MSSRVSMREEPPSGIPPTWGTPDAMTNYFGKEIAERYDDDPTITDPHVVNPMVDFLADLAGQGSALELGIGTGRVALPLSQKGVPVSGIDLSPDMIEKLKAKPGAGAIGVTVGDFATTKVTRGFHLVYLVFNTITNLISQEAQVQCFRNAAEHLVPGGYFVIETFIPELRLLPPGETIRPHNLTSSRFDFDEYSVATQGLVSHHLRKENGVFHDDFLPFRYVWPSELDLMAQIAGMRLRERWSNWHRDPFTSDSTSHVSVWEKVH